ncbi:MAG: sulfurtransferase-like selenium metabolism protein YedF [Mucinivorans sp.]
MKKIVDARGRACPEPLVMTRREINSSAVGDTIEVMLDNQTSKCNVEAFLRELAFDTQTTENGDHYSITFGITKTKANDRAKAAPRDLCSLSPQGQSSTGEYVVVLKSMTMGEGDHKLGALLMRACLNSLVELDSRPKFVILYNSGVKLATKNSDTAAALEKLASTGSEVILCGTCVDYFDIKDQIALGTISNMFRINELLSAASHVVYP